MTYRRDVYVDTEGFMDALRSHQLNDPVASLALIAVNAAVRADVNEQLRECFADELARLGSSEQVTALVSMQTVLLFDSLRFMHEQLERRSAVHDLVSRHVENALLASPALKPAPAV